MPASTIPTYGWKVVQSIDGFWSEDGGLTAMEDILTGHPDLEFIWTCNDSEGFGAIKAMENAGYRGRQGHPDRQRRRRYGRRPEA